MGMVRAGMTHTNVANQFNVNRTTISRNMILLRQTGLTTDRPRSAWPRVTTQREKRHIRLIPLRYRFVTVMVTAR